VREPYDHYILPNRIMNTYIGHFFGARDSFVSNRSDSSTGPRRRTTCIKNHMSAIKVPASIPLATIIHFDSPLPQKIINKAIPKIE